MIIRYFARAYFPRESPRCICTGMRLLLPWMNFFSKFGEQPSCVIGNWNSRGIARSRKPRLDSIINSSFSRSRINHESEFSLRKRDADASRRIGRCGIFRLARLLVRGFIKTQRDTMYTRGILIIRLPSPPTLPRSYTDASYASACGSLSAFCRERRSSCTAAKTLMHIYR